MQVEAEGLTVSKKKQTSNALLFHMWPSPVNVRMEFEMVARFFASWVHTGLLQTQEMHPDQENE